MPFNPQSVLHACEVAFAQGDNKYNCSGFVKAVAAQFGVTLTGQADDIVDSVEGGWLSIPSGPEAYQKARAGQLVVVALRGRDHQKPRAHGHVAIVAPEVAPPTRVRIHGELYHGKYPVVWGGSLGWEVWSDGDKTVGEVWSRADRDRVLYRYYPG